MFFTIFLLFCLIFIQYLFYLKAKTSKGNNLSGPIPLPILGNLLQIGFQPHVTFTKWAIRFGPIYRMKMGTKDAIVVNDHKLIKDLFNKTASTGRMGDNVIFLEITKGPYGIANSSGSAWIAQRKFTLQTLRSFGFAKSSMEIVILDEVQATLDWIRKKDRYIISATELFDAPVMSSLWRLISGKRCRWEDGRPVILDALDNFFREFLNVSTNGLFFAPFLRFLAPNLLGWNRYVKSVNVMTQLLQESIEEHKENFDPTNLRGYIDHHLVNAAKNSDPKSIFNIETENANLTASILELFVAGTETLSASLSWAMLYLSENQQVLKILQNEIDEVVCSTLPSLTDRPNMPYSEAVVSEILRITSVGFLGIPHSIIYDLEFYGYHIPKGTTLLANIYAVHHDPKIWGDPESFRPKRFLSEDGTNFVPNEALIPFSEGKRKCIGDNFFMDTLFLYLTSICQHFNILPDPDNKMEADFQPDFGILLRPKPFKVLITPRTR